MNITKNVITDLFPLYLEKECSPDTRALVEEYLQQNPQHAQELQRVASLPLPGARASTTDLDETRSLREARRQVRIRSWIMGLAIFFSLTPFSFLSTGGRTYWLLVEAPRAALTYGALGVVCWIVYAVLRSRSQSL